MHVLYVAGVLLCYNLQDTITGTAMCMSKKDPSLSCWEEVGEVAAKKDSDIESWEDDGWGTTFISHDHSRNTESSQQSSLRGGADFFDSFSTAKKSSGSSHITESPLKYDFLPPSGGQAGQNIKAPPFTSASLFGDTSGTSTANDQNSKTGSSLGNVTSFNVDDGGGGWEDWNEDFEVKPDVQEVCSNHWTVYTCHRWLCCSALYMIPVLRRGML